MRILNRFIDKRFAISAARVSRFACYLLMLFMVFGLLLSLAGRQRFRLQTYEGSFETALCAQQDPSAGLNGPVVNTADSVVIRSNAENRVDFISQVALFLLYACEVLPLLAAVWFLSRVFANVSHGEIFTEQNALFLLLYGLLQFFAAVFSPLLKLGICSLANLFSDSQMFISTGSRMPAGLLNSIPFFVAAYIIHYGIHLQDEVDHTL